MPPPARTTPSTGSVGPDKGDVKEVREAEDQVPGDLRDVRLDPPGVLRVVVVADLQQHRRKPGAATSTRLTVVRVTTWSGRG